MDPATAETLIGKGLTRSPLPVIVFDPELRVSWVNRAAERLWGGKPASQWQGRRLAHMMPGMDTAAVEQSLRRVLVTGEPALDLAVTSRSGDDPEQSWSCIQFPLEGLGNDSAGVLHMMREVTERAQ